MKKKYTKPTCCTLCLITEAKLMAASDGYAGNLPSNPINGNVPGISGDKIFNSKPSTPKRIGF
ncbi:hypothetical protein SAMN05216518_1214 [Bacteroidales bacterium KHT7]|jgi:hypothetical protein|uniref:hypothetical protein n=1 Tax=unclassified Bacteroides TaxID=2646097 RepID=UPI0004E1DDC4|nr:MULTISPECIES: hypothetical protein [unclassified Bacteroides]MBP5220176.1 hypothetical protein [Bacteroidaceae bacterium]SDG14883.1 hypothetical protein SAMN05216518_1214 [Bacteroidales bacterium KHT7]MBQ1677445.1 hypothetical protein [Bacteroidaceae bacterium]MBQ2055361.1 hypothetical protein [Bacteroidaceae bacterium]MBQ4461330.1 hypothetical protein [Bacteroidaceae bacterium]